MLHIAARCSLHRNHAIYIYISLLPCLSSHFPYLNLNFPPLSLSFPPLNVLLAPPLLHFLTLLPLSTHLLVLEVLVVQVVRPSHPAPLWCSTP